MRDPDTGRSALQEWVEYRATNTEIKGDAIFAGVYYLIFGYMDLYIEAIDSYGPQTDALVGCRNSGKLGCVSAGHRLPQDAEIFWIAPRVAA